MLDLIIEMFSNKMSKLHIDSRYYYDWISVRSVHYYQEYFSNEDVDALLEVWNSTIMETFRTIIFTSLCIISDWFQNLPLLGKEIWFKTSCDPAAVRPSTTVDGHLIEGDIFKNTLYVNIILLFSWTHSDKAISISFPEYQTHFKNTRAARKGNSNDRIWSSTKKILLKLIIVVFVIIHLAFVCISLMYNKLFD